MRLGGSVGWVGEGVGVIGGAVGVGHVFATSPVRVQVRAIQRGDRERQKGGILYISEERGPDKHAVSHSAAAGEGRAGRQAAQKDAPYRHRKGQK